MSKFNETVSNKTVNKEGHVAYSMHDKSKLVTMVLTSFFNEKKFYGDNSNEMKQLIPSVISQDPEFVSNLAVFARREFNMRSVSHVLAGFLANVPDGKPYIKRTVEGITLRGDDATEILSFYLSEFGKPIPNGLRRALEAVISTFDAYTLAKYKGEGHAVKMRDLFRICRPHPKDAQQSVMWKQLIDGTLPTPMTWESELSVNGNNKETWEKTDRFRKSRIYGSAPQSAEYRYGKSGQYGQSAYEDRRPGICPSFTPASIPFSVRIQKYAGGIRKQSHGCHRGCC